MGEFPKSLAFSGKYSSDFFNRRGTSVTRFLVIAYTLIVTNAGELRHIQKLRFWPLDAVLHDKYLLPKEEADMIASFLNPMLRLNPDKRAKASELIHHAWLDGIVVQGEIDIIRRAEEEETRKKRAAQEAAASASATATSSRGGKENVPIAVEDADVDAMKPVDDVVPGEDADVPTVPTIAAPVPGPGRPGHAHSGSKGEVPTLHAAPAKGGKA